MENLIISARQMALVGLYVYVVWLALESVTISSKLTFTAMSPKKATNFLF
jgi:hypothetical protein